MIDEERVREAFSKIREDMLYLQQEIIVLKQEIQELRQFLESSTQQTEVRHTTDNTTHNIGNYGLKQQNFHSSIGNDGVPTDRQQTDNRQINTLKRTLEVLSGNEEITPKINQKLPELSDILQDLKKDLAEKFKTLTKKEFLIFSVLYTLEEELGKVTYSDIAQRTGLTESSIRDYIIRLINKGIPIIKEKLNNKVILLKIPKELKDISTLDKLSKL